MPDARARPLLLLTAFALALLVVGAGVVWWRAPMPVEDLDSLSYCACGYSTVQFHGGRITMVKYFHATVKPGQLIGTYRVAGDKVELDILFNGKTHHDTFVRDHIGLLNPPVARFPYRYRAINGRSSKTWLNFALLRLRSEIAALWTRR